MGPLPPQLKGIRAGSFGLGFPVVSVLPVLTGFFPGFCWCDRVFPVCFWAELALEPSPGRPGLVWAPPTSFWEVVGGAGPVWSDRLTGWSAARPPLWGEGRAGADPGPGFLVECLVLVLVSGGRFVPNHPWVGVVGYWAPLRWLPPLRGAKEPVSRHGPPWDTLPTFTQSSRTSTRRTHQPDGVVR